MTFKYKDYRIEGPGRYKTMTLATDEFIRRFLLHVVPKGFHRIRHYGLLANGNRAANIAQARELLAVPSRPKQSETPEAANDEPRVLPRPCPCCGGRMIIIETFARGCEPKHRAHTGSSGDQDRHVMMPSSPIDGRLGARYPCWITAGSATIAPVVRLARTRTADLVVHRPIDAFAPTPTTHPPSQSDRVDRSRPTSFRPTLRPNPHSACCTSVPYPPRFPALAPSDAGRRSAWLASWVPASENLHRSRLSRRKKD